MYDELRQGDPEAVEDFVKKELPLVYNLCVRLCPTTQDAEDLCQDVFIRAIRALSTFKGESSPSTWVYRIAVNTWKNRLRSEAARKKSAHVSLSNQSDDDSPDRELAESDPLPDQLAERKDQKELILHALDALEPDHRAILTLRDIEDRPYEEIATVLGLSLGTVKSRISRARLALREEILKIEGAARR